MSTVDMACTLVYVSRAIDLPQPRRLFEAMKHTQEISKRPELKRGNRQLG